MSKLLGAVRSCVAATALTVATASAAVATADSPKARAVAALFADVAPEGPGLAVGIYRAGKPLYLHGFGQANLEHDSPISAGTTFYIASASKQFAAFAIALLAREGKVDLDADIRRYLPYVPDFGKPITVRQLVHHTNGFRDEAELFITSGQSRDNITLQGQIVSLVARQRDLNFEPGSEYSYNNTGYSLLAEIVKAASGKTLREFTGERVFRTLGMQHTHFADQLGEVVHGRALSYGRGADGKRWELHPQISDAVGSGGLLTTVEDLMKWVANFAHPRVGDAALIEQIGTSGRLSNGKPVEYGFGIETRTILGHRALRHAGYDSGYRAMICFFPDDDLGIVLLRNDSGELHRTTEALADIYLNGGTGTATDTPAAAPASARVLASAPGSYLSRYGQMVTISRGNDGKLQWRTAYRPASSIQFRADGTFDLGTDDRVWSYFKPRLDARGHLAGFSEVSTDGGGVVTPYERATAVSTTSQQLASLAGNYYSSELETLYRFTVEDGRLTARTLWLPRPLVFEPSVIDRFDSRSWELSVIEFERDPQGRVAGFRAHVGRGRNLLFERQ